MAVTSLPDRVSAEIDALEQCRRLPWGHYQCGVAWALVQAGYDITGCDLLYHGTVPYGAGLSSSASIEVATAVALAKLGGREELDMVEIARLCQRAENDYVGMNCGIMDQFAAAMGKRQHAIFLNCSTLEYRHVPLMLGSHTLVITNTNAPHKLTESQYNLRRAECEQALEIINSNGGHYPNLCAMRMDELERYAGVLDSVLYRRARHCVTEETRTRQSIEALEAGDIAAFGKLLCDGHISMRDDYEATGAELDAVFDIAMTLDGVIGSRMTGGGFGGCGISIVKSDKVEACKQTLSEEYTRRVGYAPSFYQSNVGDGAREVVDWRQ
jgi:galactokinase